MILTRTSTMYSILLVQKMPAVNLLGMNLFRLGCISCSG